MGISHMKLAVFKTIEHHESETLPARLLSTEQFLQSFLVLNDGSMIEKQELAIGDVDHQARQ